MILCINKLGIDLSGGEEQYLAFAKQWADPYWIKNSFTYTEYPGSRIVFQWIVGPILNLIQFESATLILRALNFLLYAHALSLLFKKLESNWIHVWVILQTYLLITQSFFSSSWMFISFEPKTLAYALGLYAIYFYLNRRLIISFILLGIGAYFHVLVAGWLTLYLVLHLIFFKKQYFQAILSGGITLLISSPILVYILSGVSRSEFIKNSSFTADHIYAYYRLPHHIGIFDSLSYFWNTHGPGFIQLVLVLLFFVIIRKFVQTNFKSLIEIALIIGFIVCMYVVIAWVDHRYLFESGGLGLQTYPFRGNVWIKFFFIVIIGKWLTDWTLGIIRSKALKYSLFFFLITLTSIQGINNIIRAKAYPGTSDYVETIRYVEQKTADSIVFTTIGLEEEERYRLGRLMQREPFVEFKFVPAGTQKIFEWYRRCLLFDQWQDLKDLHRIPEEGIDWIISKTKIDLATYITEEELGSYYLYRTKEE